MRSRSDATRSGVASPVWAVVLIATVAVALHLLRNAAHARTLVVPFDVVVGVSLTFEALAALRVVVGWRSRILLRLSLVPATLVSLVAG